MAILQDDFKKAAGMMKALAATELLSKTEYRDWPLFKEFRKSKEFLDSYQSIYGHALTPIESSPADVLFGPSSKIFAVETKTDSEKPEKAITERENDTVPSELPG